MKTLPAFLLLACLFSLGSPLVSSEVESITLNDGTVLENVKVLRVNDSGISVFVNGSLQQLSFPKVPMYELDRLAAKYGAQGSGDLRTERFRTLERGQRLFAKKGDLNPSVELLGSVRFKEVERSGRWVCVSVELWINEDASVPTRKESPPQADPSGGITLEEWKWDQSTPYLTINGVIKNETGSAVGVVEMHYEIYDGDTFVSSGSTYANRNAIGSNQTSPIKIIERYEGRPLSELRIKYSFEY